MSLRTDSPSYHLRGTQNYQSLTIARIAPVFLYSFGFLHMGACSISSKRTFYICRGGRFVTIPANIKKSHYKLCYK